MAEHRQMAVEEIERVVACLEGKFDLLIKQQKNLFLRRPLFENGR